MAAEEKEEGIPDEAPKLKGRTSSVELKTSVPLLKFDKHEKGNLEEAGVNALKRIPPGAVICPLIFIGDGRGGKSYLASRMAGDEDSFVSSDTAEPVTEGIDIVLKPMAPLLAGMGIEPTGEKNEYLLILDCEGGNNAMAAIRTLVNVFGIVIGTQVVFVASGMASEQALQNLAASLAACSLIKLEGCKLPDRKLHFVVNKNTLKYKPEALDDMLNTSFEDSSRQEIRETIKESFSERSFDAITMMGMPTFEEQVTALRKKIYEARKPFSMGDTEIGGVALCGLLELIVTEIRKSNEVSFPSMQRYVVFEGFLLPITVQLAKEYEETLPEVTDWVPDLDSQNTKPQLLKEYDSKVSHISQKALVDEAREKLIQELDRRWEPIDKTNNAFGDQVLGEIEQETREVENHRNEGPIGGRGLLQKIKVTMKKMRVESRSVIHRKRGGEPERGPWIDSGNTMTRIEESAFEEYGRIPVIRGSLKKHSPNILRQLIQKKQPRSCVLKDGHFCWWSKEKAENGGEASGCINFLVNRAQVVKDPSDEHVFIIKPAEGKVWTEMSNFSGGENREFHLDASESDTKRDDWVEGIQQHIKFADAAFQQVGVQKLIDQVGNAMPTMDTIDGR